MAYYGLQAQDLAQMHGATLFTPDSPGGSDEGSIAKEAARFYAKLTFSAVHAPTGITYFSWKEQQRVVDSGGGIPSFVDLPGGRFGNVPGDPTGATAFSNPIVEPNGATPSVPTIVRASRSYFDPALGMVHVGTVTTAAAANLTVKDLQSGTVYTPVAEIIYDSTPTAYDGTKGDYVFSYNAGTQTLTIRLNGYTGTVNGMVFDNGLLKSLTTLTITSNFPPGGTSGHAYSFTCTATGGVQPYSWSISAGALPPGLTLSSSGVLSGTPTTPGTYAGITIKVTDSGVGTATQSGSITIS